MVRLFIILLAACCSLTACRKDPVLWQVSNLSGNRIAVAGHGGMGNKYRFPMDSYTSLMHSVEAGVDGVEMDLRLSADSELVLFHNDKLGEMTNCTGVVRDHAVPVLTQCKYRDLAAGEEFIIRPAAFFDAVNNPRVFFTFDCKIKLEEGQAYMEAFGNRLLALIRHYGLQDRCYVESYSTDFLWFLCEREPGLRFFLYTDLAAEGIAFSKVFPLHGITMDMRKITVEEIVLAHRQGLRVALFNMSTDKENLEAITMSPDIVQTDRVEYMVNVLKDQE